MATARRTQHARRQRSPAWLLVCVLAIATALICYQVAASKAPPALPPPPPDRIAAGQVALVSRFYTAVNQALETGETTMLEPLVAEELIEHPAPAGDTSGRTALLQHLLALRAVYPDLQLVTDDLQATADNQVTARVQVTGIASGTFLGLPVPVGVPVWPALETFRLEEKQIVERWAGMETAVDLTPLFATHHAVPKSGTASLQVARVTYPPGSIVPLGPAPRSPLTYLEVAAQTQVDGTRAAEPADTIVGTLLSPEPGLNATVREDAPVVVLEVTIMDGAPDAIHPLPKRAVTVKESVLATAVVDATGWPAMAIAAGWVSLAPGATLAFPAASGPVLLIVESGDLALTAKAGNIAWPGTWVAPVMATGADRDLASIVAPNQEPLPTGKTAQVEANTTSLWHNPGAEPATVLVLVLTPTGDVPAASRATPLPAATPRDSWCTEPWSCRGLGRDH